MTTPQSTEALTAEERTARAAETLVSYARWWTFAAISLAILSLFVWAVAAH